MNIPTKIFFVFVIILALSNCNKKDPATELSAKIDKLLEYWNTGNFEGIEDVLHPEFAMRMSPDFKPEKGIAVFKKSVSDTRESFPDFQVTLEEGAYGENIAAGRWTIHATSRTGKIMNVMGISMLHFVDGKIKDEWISSNDLLWMEQLDYKLLPPAR